MRPAEPVKLRSAIIAISALSSLCGVAAAGPPLRYVNAQEVSVSFQSESTAPIDTVQLWLSTDAGGHWTPHTEFERTATSIRFRVPEDGAYDLYLVLENAAGRSAPLPQPRSEPHVRLIVDTRPPIVQIHDARRVAAVDAGLALGAAGGRNTCSTKEDGLPIAENTQSTPAAGQVLEIRVSLYDPHLSERALRLFFRKQGQSEWLDGGPVREADGHVHWQPPDDLVSETLDVLLLATDLAGNRAHDTKLGVAAPRTDAGAAAQDEGRVTDDEGRTKNVGTGHDPSSVATHPSASVAPADPHTRRMRVLARQHAAEGRYALAAARLEEALRQDPDASILHVDLGHAYFRMRRYDEAERSFASGAALLPEPMEALDGLALVAVAQRRFADARTHLTAMLERTPDSPQSWLRLGDVEHRLGDVQAAIAAWRRAESLSVDDPTMRERLSQRLRLFSAAP